MNQRMVRVKVLSGIMLLILTPGFLFVGPLTNSAVLRDLMLVIWGAFILWLVVTGMKESRPADSK